MHQYYDAIKQVVDRVENTYGINEVTSNGRRLSELPVESFIEGLFDKMDRSPKDAHILLATKTHADFHILSGVLMRLEFFDLKILNLSTLLKGKKSVESLRIYSKQLTLNVESRESASDVIEELMDFESVDNLFYHSLEYRLLRLFIVIVAYKNYVAASIIARVALNQLKFT